ncbi:MAG: hypothetical protein JSS81_17585 [Acidobacteria bacterium]|nr:hypothetical protein [Acidobacteriota bacterium]
MLELTGDSDEILIGESFISRCGSAALAALFPAVLFFEFGADELSLPYWFVFAGTFGAVFALYLTFGPSINVRVCRSDRTVSVRRRGFFSSDFRIYSFDEIRAPIFVHKTPKSPYRYKLYMPLTKGRMIDLSRFGWWTSTAAEFHDAARFVNEWVFPQPKPPLPPPIRVKKKSRGKSRKVP